MAVCSYVSCMWTTLIPSFLQWQYVAHIAASALRMGWAWYSTMMFHWDVLSYTKWTTDTRHLTLDITLEIITMWHSLRFTPNILQFGSKLFWYICWNCTHRSDMWPNPHPPINKVSRTWEMPTLQKHWKWRPYKVRQPISESSQCQPRHLYSQVSQVQMHITPTSPCPTHTEAIFKGSSRQTSLRSNILSTLYSKVKSIT